MKMETRLSGDLIFLRYPRLTDQEEFIELNRSSADFHQGLANPPKDRSSFQDFIAKNDLPENETFLICEMKNESVAGAIALLQIVYGGFCNAYLGYYLAEEYSGKGFGTEAVSLTVRFAFEELKLHRIEANIQPHNLASIAIVKKNNFVKEGFSRNYLRIAGEWRDHERWAIVNGDWK